LQRCDKLTLEEDFRKKKEKMAKKRPIQSKKDRKLDFENNDDSNGPSTSISLSRRGRSTPVAKKLEKKGNDFDSDASCIFCCSLHHYSKAEEECIKCPQCKEWTHNECAGSPGKTWVCDLCLADD